MILASPEYLVLLPLLAFMAWRWPWLRLLHPLRALCLLLLVLCLCQPKARLFGSGLDLWVLVDRSASAASALQPRLTEWEKILERSKGTDDRVFFVDYADVPGIRGQIDANLFDTPPQFTRTASALQFALSRIDPHRATRMLLLTDGYSTEPLTGLESRLLEEQIGLDYRLSSGDVQNDYQIEKISLPTRVQQSEPFLIELEISGTPDASFPVELWRGGRLLTRSQATLSNGRSVLRFTDRLSQTGSHRYTARIAPEKDQRPQNNFSENWIEVAGGPRLLLITGYLNDPLVPVLQNQGFQLEVVADPATLNLGQLTGAKAVILNNVPAYKLPPDFLRAIPFYVKAQGGGLLMAGGKFSFGSGGYFQSPVDELLPVSMELRQEHRKLAVAMAIVLDRSGSMAAGVTGGRTKMDLANEGSARAVELLGDQDAVAVIAVDSSPHPFVNLSQIGPNRHQINDAVRRIVSMGGGIFVYTGLKAGYEELKKAKMGQRHLILFADAADAEEPGDYKNLLSKMTADGVTVSVIGLGSETDPDAAFLKDVAARGNGRIFFNNNPAELPGVFAQETVAVARSTFIEEAVRLKPTAAWMQLAARPLKWPEGVDGYNLSYLKAEAASAAFTEDEYNAPLVAFWQRGAGRSAAVSFPLGGDFSARIRAWPEYGDFAQTLARWLMGNPLPPGLSLRTRHEGTRLQIELLYDHSWEERLALNAPHIALAVGGEGPILEPAWQRMEPGRFLCAVELDPGKIYRGAVQTGPYTLPFGPVFGGRNEEWNFDRERIAELKALARLTGGGERTDLSKIWQAPRRSGLRDLRPFVLTALLIVFLLEVLVTRLGLHRAEVYAFFRKMPRPRLPQKAPNPPGGNPIPPPLPPEEPTTRPAPPLPAEANRQSLFDKAKMK
ncbi:MAG: VWA domain-containing protein [Verrucomicrobiae bacterium]|nr:VWA domain-containing protein [Verrucomicrobiae bacterium]